MFGTNGIFFHACGFLMFYLPPLWFSRENLFIRHWKGVVTTLCFYGGYLVVVSVTYPVRDFARLVETLVRAHMAQSTQVSTTMCPSRIPSR